MQKATAIPVERLQKYADTAHTFGDLNAMIAVIRQIAADCAILHSEGRTTAAMGAYRLLASVVRRLCATQASDEAAATTKIGMLAMIRQSYRESKGDVLMAVMVDAAINLEMQRWPALVRH